MTPVKINDEGCLVCPNCGDIYLHHQGVYQWNRSSEDSEIGTYIDSKGVSHTGNFMSGCPSPRRDGLIVTFSCETCHMGSFGDRPCKTPPFFELCIWQHKGQTYLKWGDLPIQYAMVSSNT